MKVREKDYITQARRRQLRRQTLYSVLLLLLILTLGAALAVVYFRARGGAA